MTAAQFHAVGVAAAAPPLGTGESVAERLSVTQQAVDRYIEEICSGSRPIIGVTAFPYPSQVPAFEAVFEWASTRCPVPQSTLDLIRGSVARSMASNAALLDRIQGRARANQFCEAVDATESLTSTVVMEAMLETKMVSTRYEDIAELGVALLLKSCPALFGGSLS